MPLRRLKMSGVSFASERLQTGKHSGLEHRRMPDKHPFDLIDEMFSPAMSDKVHRADMRRLRRHGSSS